MSFLFPLAAWLGVLAIPVVAMYLLKTRQRRKLASTLLFWDALKPKVENSPLWRKLRRWLSLALQLLILALLVSAIARPAFVWEQEQPRQTVLVLDPSASMQAGDRSRWDRAMAEARQRIQQLRIGDEMALLLASEPPRLLSGWTASARQLRDQLDGAQPLPFGTNPQAAFELAAELSALRPQATIEVLSDSVWPEVRFDWDALEGRMEVHGVEEESARNSGITNFAVRRSNAVPGEWQLEIEVVATVAFEGTLEIVRNGEPMDRALVRCDPGEVWRKSWNGSSYEAMAFVAHLTPVDGDVLAVDDDARCSLTPLAPMRVLLSADPDSPMLLFLQAALSALPSGEWLMAQEIPDPMPEEIGAVITVNGLAPEHQIDIPLIMINPDRSGWWGERRGEVAKAPVTEVNRNSQVLRHVSLDTVTLGAIAEWEPAADADVLAASFENPFVFGRWNRGEGPRWLVLGFDPLQSDLPLRTAFPILIGNVLQSIRDEAVTDDTRAVVPGLVESRLAAQLETDDGRVRTAGPRLLLPNLPGWWWVLLLGLLLVVGEAVFYHRRVTD